MLGEQEEEDFEDRYVHGNRLNKRQKSRDFFHRCKLLGLEEHIYLNVTIHERTWRMR
jgi:hypothetical protein